MIRSDGSLYIPQDVTHINARTGRFLKGHEPKNKGKRWDEWMSKKAQRNSAKGWKNLDKHRPTTRPDNAGRCRKEVVAVHNNGKFHIFPHIGIAGEWIGGSRENVGRCCRSNAERHINRKTGKINTNHQYKGVRFYFASDPIWVEKIGKEIEL